MGTRGSPSAASSRINKHHSDRATRHHFRERLRTLRRCSSQSVPNNLRSRSHSECLEILEPKIFSRATTFSRAVNPRAWIRLRGWRACFAAIVVAQLLGCGNRAAPLPPPAGNPSEEAVHFSNGEISLSGTLVLPAGNAPHPAVVLFHGSGPLHRDLETARWFASQGVAALAYDKRGVGESTGNFRSVPFMELTGDGLAGVAYLKSRKEIDPKQIGVWGLSQGGWLGPLAASRSSDVAFVIAVSGPGVSPGDQMRFYYATELRGKGASEEDVKEADDLRRDVWNYMYSGNGYEAAKAEMDRDRAKRWYSEVKSQQDDLFGTLESPAEREARIKKKYDWFTQEMNYDPVPTLQALRVPALFIFGDEDRLVPVPESIAIIRRTLTSSNHQDFTIQELHGADHGMYMVTTGELDSEYLATMQKWLTSHVRIPL